MTTTSILLAVLLGLGLSASTGLNTFLPLLLLSAAARYHIAGITLGAKFHWLASDVAIVVLIIACVVEIIADKFPAVDHFLDVVGAFVRPLAGATAAASVLTGVDPTVAAIAGIIIGAPTSFGFHSLKAATRVASSATTFGCANPLLSLIEDVVSFALSLFAIFAPITVPLLLLIIGWALWRVVKRMRRTTTPPATSATAGSAP
ncbi:MAG TPA: DUF4126 domain-containing protein [Thermoanaerobaculia bacterium]|nr:DUF4126 domain-containing protein [Thermoanaerobaculia bacterium]